MTRYAFWDDELRMYRMPIQSAANQWLDIDPQFDVDSYIQAWNDYWDMVE